MPRLSGCGCGGGETAAAPPKDPAAAAIPTAVLTGGPTPEPVTKDGDGIKLASFLGGLQRNVYGIGPAPHRLDVIWRVAIGHGWTGGRLPKDPPSIWSGIGWTGQPVLVRDGGRLYVLFGGYDHHLHKVDALSGKVVWESAWDDIIKSTPTVIEDPDPAGEDERYLVLAGSRRGYPLDFDSDKVAPYRAVSFASGKEVWRLPVPRTRCYSRDCDGSGLFYDGRLYMGVESGWFYKIDPFGTQPWQGHATPTILADQLLLGTTQDRRVHKGNLVLEASPSLLGQTLFVSSGAGHVYGLRPSDLAVVWDYRTGSDLDGTPIPTGDGCLLQSVEKQYIPGHGGVLKLDPSKPPKDAVVWFLPTEDRELSEWRGGVLGSVAVNDASNRAGRRPALAAVVAVDGCLYLFSQDTLAEGTVKGPNNQPGLKAPLVLAKVWMGGGITTPIIVGDAVVAAGYDNIVHLYRITYAKAKEGDAGAVQSADGDWWTVGLTQRAAFTGGGAYESSPVLWDGRVYIGSRDGYFYCLGDR